MGQRVGFVHVLPEKIPGAKASVYPAEQYSQKMKPPSSPVSNSEGCDTAPPECGAPMDNRCSDMDKPVNGRVEPEVKAEAGEVLQNGAEGDGGDAGIVDYDEDLDEQLETAYNDGLTMDTKDDSGAPEDWESEIVDTCCIDSRNGQNNDNVFVPCHTHPLSSRRKPNWTELSEGQFDDADT